MRNTIADRRTQLQQAISELTPGPQRRYPARLQTRIAEYGRERIAAGVAAAKVCAEIGVSQPTLVRILEQAPAPMHRVRVAEVKEETPTARTLTVRGPRGLVIEGLDIDDVAALVKALS
jgi:hypothetical protein